jgi:glucans biosynthesis protein C
LISDQLTPSSTTDPKSTITQDREYGLDWLRVFAFAVLIFYHSGMAFVSWGWHIKNGETSHALELVMLFFNRWRLPLLFFISGAGVFFSLRRRTLGRFAGERLTRLLVPLVFAMFVVVPPQIYFEHLHRGREYSSYWEFYRTVFQFVPYPEGSFSWHHLWFVAYILVYSLVGIPIFAFLKSDAGQAATGRLAQFFESHRAAIYLISVPSLLVALWLGPRWPTTHNLVSDWANLTGSFITFLWGFIVASNHRLLDLVQKRRKEFLCLGIVLTLAFYGLRKFGGGLPRELVSTYLGMAWIFALIGYARAMITRPGRWLSYATQSVYPFYFVHQTITVALVFWIVKWNWPVAPKLAVTVAGTFIGSWCAVELLRRTPVTRLLFGMKVRSGNHRG